MRKNATSKAAMKAATFASFGLSLLSSIILLVFPWYESGRTVLQTSRPMVLIPISIPVLAALMPILVPRRGVRIGAAAVLAACVFLGSFSIGLFFVPGTTLMILACAMDRVLLGH